jgi:hypothetical protein
MPTGSTQGPSGTTPIPPIDAGTSALTASPGVAAVGVDPAAASVPPAAPAAATADTGPAIEALSLVGSAKKGAYALKKAHPSVRFTSGFREKQDQARAMAQNVAKKDKRKWIENTYVSTKASQACQKWVDDNPDKTTEEDIAEGLLSVINELTDAEQAAFGADGCGIDWRQPETRPPDAERVTETIYRGDVCNCQARVRSDTAGHVAGLIVRSAC